MAISPRALNTGERWKRQAHALGTVAVLLGAILAAPLPARATPPGVELDPSFGNAGMITTAGTAFAGKFFGSSSYREAVAIQKDVGEDKIVVASGGLSNGHSAFVVTRFHANGSLDSSFATNGFATVNFGATAYSSPVTSEDHAFAVDIQKDNKIVVAGGSLVGNNQEFAVIRLTPEGVLDPTFGEPTSQGAQTRKGLNVIAINPSFVLDAAYSVAVQPDDKIVLGGISYSDSTTSRWAVLRLTSFGDIDTGFAAGGVAITTFSTAGIVDPLSFVNDLALVPVPNTTAVKIVAVGWVCDDRPVCGIGVERLLSNGHLDTTFHQNGQVAFSAFGNMRTYAVAMQGSKIIVAGFGLFPSDAGHPDGVNKMWVARVDAAGNLDSTFGSSGVTFFSASGDPPLRAFAMAVDAAGRIVVAGDNPPGPTQSRFASVARFTYNGALDKTFDLSPADTPEDDGYVITKLGGSSSTDDLATGLAIEPTGAIVVVGTTCPIGGSGSDCNLGLVRHNALAGPPINPAMTYMPAFQRSTQFKIGWGAQDGGNGIKNYDVRYRSATFAASSFSGPWSLESANPATSATVSALAGRTYCMSARARDTIDEVSAWGPERCTNVPIDDANLPNVSGWTHGSNSSAMLGTLSRATRLGASMSLRAHFRRIALMVAECSICGTIDVIVNGIRVGRVSTHASSIRYRVLFWVDSFTTAPLRTVVIKDVSRSGVPVFVDGFGSGL